MALIFTLIGAVVTILVGVWYILSKVFKLGLISSRLAHIAQMVTKLEKVMACLVCSSCRR